MQIVIITEKKILTKISVLKKNCLIEHLFFYIISFRKKLFVNINVFFYFFFILFKFLLLL